MQISLGCGHKVRSVTDFALENQVWTLALTFTCCVTLRKMTLKWRRKQVGAGAMESVAWREETWLRNQKANSSISITEEICEKCKFLGPSQICWLTHSNKISKKLWLTLKYDNHRSKLLLFYLYHLGKSVTFSALQFLCVFASLDANMTWIWRCLVSCKALWEYY